MKKLNKKAFTLIEILATVTILGILSVVAMVSVNSIIQNAKEKHYTNAEDQLELAGQSYAQQYRNELPKVIGQKVKIPMRKLVDTNYIEQIKDYSDNNCDLDKSYVQIFKYSQDDYSYLAYLDCPVYDSNKNNNMNVPKLDGTEITGDMDSTDQWLHIVASDDSKLISYSYIIYKYGQEIKNSGSIYLPNYDTKITKEISLKEYAPGALKAVVTATNIYGNTATKTVTHDFNDNTPPTCVIAEVDQRPKAWVKDPVKVTVKCNDKKGSGCEREEYTKTFKSSTDYDYITIKDNAGNTAKCKVSVFLDVTRPTIRVTAYKRNASGGKTGNAIGTVVAEHNNPDMTLDLTNINSTKWLNSISNPNGVYYEVEYSDGESTVIYEAKENPANLLATDASINNMSVLDSGQTTGKSLKTNYSTTVDGHRLYALHASDEIGNYVDLKIITPFDKTPPTTPTLQNPYLQADGSIKWSKTDYSVVLTSQDALSGIESFQYTYKAGATEVTGTNTTGYKKYADSSASPQVLKAFTASPFTKERNQSYYARVCDVAGNCSPTAETTVKLDKTIPTCSLSVDLTEIKFSAKSDPKTNDVNSGLADYGLSTSPTASYDEKDSLAFSKTTFYGHVVDVAGNTNTCSKTVFSTSHKYACSSGSLDGSSCYSYPSASCTTEDTGSCTCRDSDGSSAGYTFGVCSGGNCGCAPGLTVRTNGCDTERNCTCSAGMLVSGEKCKVYVAAAYDVYYCSSGTKLNDSYCYR